MTQETVYKIPDLLTKICGQGQGFFIQTMEAPVKELSRAMAKSEVALADALRQGVEGKTLGGIASRFTNPDYSDLTNYDPDQPLYRLSPQPPKFGETLLVEYLCHGGTFAVIQPDGKAELCIPQREGNIRVYSYQRGKSTGAEIITGQDISAVREEKTANLQHIRL